MFALPVNEGALRTHPTRVKMLAALLMTASMLEATRSPPSQRNVLYIVFDDLRPELSNYGQPRSTPNIQKLADSGLTFDRAYCQESVCSPSRNSFTTGRRPNSTKVWNFINHFRQATCPTLSLTAFEGTAMAGGFINPSQVWGPIETGGVAQCCTSCSASPGCAGWTMKNGNCTLFNAITRSLPCSVDSKESHEHCASGSPGKYEQWTTLPEHFKANGYLTLGTGKFYHDGGRGLGGAPGDAAHPAGNGSPPLADKFLSWSNVSVQWPNTSEYVERWGKVPYSFPNFNYLVPDDEPCRSASNASQDFCVVDFPPSGEPPHPPTPGVAPLADFVTYSDAIVKLRYASRNREESGQPFFLVTGIKRPHLNWRTPRSYEELYPAESVALPAQRTLDSSVDPIAYSVFPMELNNVSGDFVKTPYASGSDAELREMRRHYYAAVSWADHAAGKVLDELEALGLRPSTMVVLHSDHGWHLGEYAMWEKRSNWELGTRVPMVMRVPWLRGASAGKHSRALVELVDIYQTVCDVMGLPLPTDEAAAFDGVSLRPILERPEQVTSIKPYALSTFPRCAHVGMPIYGARGQPNGNDNSCLEVERSAFTWMGYTMRTDRYRYTEFVGWNGSTLAPVWSAKRAVELYDHRGDDGPWTDPDRFENVNLAPGAPKELLESLSRMLHSAFGFPDS
jgi:arylsulfatase A-like enzyme